MKHLFFVTFFCSVFAQSLFAGVFDTVFTVGPEFHQQVIRHVYRSDILKMDSAGAMAALTALEQQANAAGAHAAELYSIGYQGAYLLSRNGNDPEPGKKLFMRAIEGAETYDLPHLRGYFTFFLGYALYRRNSLDEALVYMFEGADDMASVGYARVPAVELCLFLLGDLYFDFDNYQRAIEYYQEALTYSRSRDQLMIMIFNKLAAASVETKDYEAAQRYFDRGIELADSIQDTVCLAILRSNLAQLYIELQEIDRAEPLLHFAYEQGSRYGEQGTVMWCLLQLATIDTRRGNYDRAMQRAGLARKMLQRPHPFALEAEVDYYQMKSDLYDAMGLYREASLHKDSLKFLRDSIAVKRDANMLANMRAQITAERHRSALRVLEKEREIQRILRNVTIAIALIVVLALAWLFHTTWRRQKKARLQYNMERAEAERKLRAFRSDIQRKNQLIESFREQLEYQPVAMEAPDREALQEQLYQSIILTEEDWSEFKKLFERVYPAFISQLQIKYPELTIAEIRLLTLLKLNLSTSEIAGMLGILPQSVRKTRSRLMKKLDVQDYKRLPSLIGEI